LATLEQYDETSTHRLIPAKYGAASLLETLGLPAGVLADLSEFDVQRAKGRLRAEHGDTSTIAQSPKPADWGIHPRLNEAAGAADAAAWV
jgi:hypothetical protein